MKEQRTPKNSRRFNQPISQPPKPQSQFAQHPHSISVEFNIQNFKEEIERIKKPHLTQVETTMQTFHNRVIQFEKVVNKGSEVEESSEQESSEQVFENDDYSENFTQMFLSQKRLSSQRKIIDSQKELGGAKLYKKLKAKQKEQLPGQIRSSYENRLREWEPCLENHLIEYEDVQRRYHQIFQKKLPPRKPDFSASQDYRQSEMEMLKTIFYQIQKTTQNGVTFTEILQFFQEFQLFHSFYNIPPDDLENILKETARSYSDMLTKDEFINMLLHDRPIVVGFHKSAAKEIEARCILDAQSWKDLKSIFDTLDTFGNETINIFGFFHRVKTNPSYRGLLDADTIQFPDLCRKYTLRKVMFNFENKYEHRQKQVKWHEIELFIQNFSHKQEPSIDYIYQQQIKRASITRETNYFLLQSKILNMIKGIFARCPRYCKNFVKIKFFGEELFESTALKHHRYAAVRIEEGPKSENKQKCITLLDAIKNMMRVGFDYLDLDEVLQYFTIKGPSKKDFTVEFDKVFEGESTSEDEFEDDLHKWVQKKKIKKMKSLSDLKKVTVRRDPCEKFRKVVYDTTTPVQFKLHSRSKPTIRQIRVQRMVEQIQVKETEEMAKKFKANPIPASINPQRYKSYVKRMQKKKQLIFQQLSKKNEKDRRILQYLESNTKLFSKQQPRGKQFESSNQRKNGVFEPKPLPWFINEQMLDIIIEEKEARRRRIFEETKKKYEEYYWEKLPYNGNRTGERENSRESLDKILGQKHKEQDETEKRIIAKPVPNFELLQKKFAQQLKNKKKQYKPTIPKEFNLTSPKQKPIFTEDQDAHHTMLSEKTSPKSKIRPKSSSPPPEIGCTKKYLAWIQMNQRRHAQKQYMKAIEVQEQEDRKLKHQNFARYMMANLGNSGDNRTILRIKSQEKLKRFKAKQKYLRNDNNRRLAQMYARVLKRPFLFERSVVEKETDSREYASAGPQMQKRNKFQHHKPHESSYPDLPQELYPREDGQMMPQDEEQDLGFQVETPENENRYYDFDAPANQSF